MRSLPEPSDERAPGEERGGEPRTALELQLTALWRHILGNESIGIRDNFFEVGGHSLKAVELFSEIERTHGVEMPLAVLFESPTIEQLARTLTAATWKTAWRSLVAIRPAGDAVPFFAIPGVGGNVLVFAQLAKLLGPSQPFYGLQARGLDSNESPFSSVEEAARHYVAEIRSVQARGPYFVGGTCTGGVFAYETAQQLVAQGEQVVLVIMESWHPSSFRARRRTSLFWPLRFLWSKLFGYGRDLTELPLRNWTEYLGVKIGNAAAALHWSREERLEPTAFASERVVQATLRAVATYKPRPYPGSVLNVVAGNRPVAAQTSDTRRAWNDLAAGPVRCEVIAAEDSGRLFVSPHVEVLARYIVQYAKERLGGVHETARTTPTVDAPQYSAADAATS